MHSMHRPGASRHARKAGGLCGFTVAMATIATPFCASPPHAQHQCLVLHAPYLNPAPPASAGRISCLLTKIMTTLLVTFRMNANAFMYGFAGAVIVPPPGGCSPARGVPSPPVRDSTTKLVPAAGESLSALCLGVPPISSVAGSQKTDLLHLRASQQATFQELRRMMRAGGKDLPDAGSITRCITQLAGFNKHAAAGSTLVTTPGPRAEPMRDMPERREH